MADETDPHLKLLYRYPVKAFGPEDLSHACLLPGRGIAGDRAFAIAGPGSPPRDGAWVPCATFVTMSGMPALARYRARVVGPDAVKVTGVDGATATLTSEGPVDDSQLARWQGWFGTGIVPRLAVAGKATGYWDHRDAQLSIINLASLRTLASKVGRPLDSLRFRANLYIDGLAPWAELDWVGRRVAVGDAVLEILRPIDRCSVTSVDRRRGVRDVNVPYALGRHFGHIFCGVYARVVEEAEVRPGAALHVGDRVRPAGTADTAPPLRDWPRPFRITGWRDEGASARSLWLEDRLGALPARAGDHLRLHHAAEDRAAWRSYTVSGWGADGRVRITVKREPAGFVSGWLHEELEIGHTLLVSGPHAGGDPLAGDGPLVLISGGIGITPTAAMLRELVARGAARRVHVLHSARSRRQLALWDEVRDAVAALGGSANLFLSRATTEEAQGLGAHAGRIDLDRLRCFAGLPDAHFHLCGPADMVDAMRTVLLRASVAEERIAVELFASPKTEGGEPRPIENSGPFRVTFRRSGRQAMWDPGCGSLLEVADAAGLALAAGCRAGGCMSCRQRVLAGRTQALVDPPVPLTRGEVLLCSAVPASDVVIDA